MLFSRIVASFKPSFESTRNSVIENHRDGNRSTDGETNLQHEVERRRAEDHAEKGPHDQRQPRSARAGALRPECTDEKFARNGLSDLLARAASSGVMFSLDIRVTSD